MSAGAEIEVDGAEAVRCDAAVIDELIESFRDSARGDAVRLSRLVAVADATPAAQFAPFEVSCAVAFTRQAATAELALAIDIVRRLPDVHAALSRGDIFLPQARVIRDGVACVELTVARRIAAELLPSALGLTTGQLRARVAKMVIAADPQAATRRHEARRRQRRMVVQPTEDSCAHLMGLDLPADKAMSAANRVAALARAVKQAGDPRSLDQIRADAFLNLLLGRPTGEEPRARDGVELVADLHTLAGLAERPGHLTGYGPVIADIARQVAEQQRHTPWTFTVYDNTTGDIHTGTTRARPTNPPTDPAAGRATEADRAGQPDRAQPPHQPTRADRVGHPTNDRPANQAPPDGGTSHGTPAQAERPGGTTASDDMFGDPNRRFPNAALVRHIRARDRTCRAPGCRRPARQTDLDHTIAYEAGGRTVRGNLGPLCRYHHRAKHNGGWRLHQISPGIFIWQSPLGKIYIVRPEPP